MKIIDISQKLHHGTPVWPGDTPYSFQLNWTKEQTGSVNVGQLTMSTHTGTHIDAPYHFDHNGKKVADLPLERFIGPALVVNVSGKTSIGAEDVQHLDLTEISKLLLKTSSWENKSEFPSEITFLQEDLAPYLMQQGVDLIGVDVPSVDPIDSKNLPAHHSIENSHIQILEGIVLDEVEEGIYDLIALPLPLTEADGCPVRAILIDRT
ncbi:arylformamidase [Bacillus pakistanensis]|uniref:Kynurenine formamidase n=1 Tax=Rossellomorea pakistanensis TaxID=992288 RepID=A0ABS2NJ59_9BACI|nr:arylformamidase [Bacillus pakistanensis]MBM7587870.1 arylformamidase [Bacillus pakistanensis]